MLLGVGISITGRGTLHFFLEGFVVRRNNRRWSWRSPVSRVILLKLLSILGNGNRFRVRNIRLHITIRFLYTIRYIRVCLLLRKILILVFELIILSTYNIRGGWSMIVMLIWSQERGFRVIRFHFSLNLYVIIFVFLLIFKVYLIRTLIK